MVAHSPAARDGRWRFNIGRRDRSFSSRVFTMVHFHKERFMKPENKIPVLTRLSDEMTAVVNFQQPGLPPGLPMAILRPSVSIIFLSAVSGMPTRRP